MKKRTRRPAPKTVPARGTAAHKRPKAKPKKKRTAKPQRRTEPVAVGRWAATCEFAAFRLRALRRRLQLALRADNLAESLEQRGGVEADAEAAMNALQPIGVDSGFVWRIARSAASSGWMCNATRFLWMSLDWNIGKMIDELSGPSKLKPAHVRPGTARLRIRKSLVLVKGFPVPLDGDEWGAGPQLLRSYPIHIGVCYSAPDVAGYMWRRHRVTTNHGDTPHVVVVDAADLKPDQLRSHYATIARCLTEDESDIPSEVQEMMRSAEWFASRRV